MEALNGTNIDGAALNLFFNGTVRIVAFYFAIVREAKNLRNVFETETTIDTLVLIHPRFCPYKLSLLPVSLIFADNTALKIAPD